MFDPEILLAKWGNFAPYIIFGLAVLAGLNLPISIDILLALSALIAAHYLTEQWLLIFVLFTLGCIFSAWVSYSLGRFFGKISKSTKVEKIAKLHAKFGPFAFFICRFIPFGVRNLFFMSSGFSKYPFPKFAMLDAAACTIWSTLFFFSVYCLGQSFEAVMSTLKHLNIIFFSLFAVVGISTFLFFRLRKKKIKTE